MRAARSIRQRRKPRNINKSFDLQLTSLLDILTIILVFLLKTYSTSVNSFSSVPGIKMPISASPDVPPDSLLVIITPEAITFENERILEFIQTGDSLSSEEASYSFQREDLDEGGRRIISLYNQLSEAREDAELLRAKSQARNEDGDPLPFDGVLAIQADKRINFDTIRKVMFTAGAAGYRVFRLLAMKRDG